MPDSPGSVVGDGLRNDARTHPRLWKIGAIVVYVCCALYAALGLYGVARGYSVRDPWQGRLLDCAVLSAGLLNIWRLWRVRKAPQAFRKEAFLPLVLAMSLYSASRIVSGAQGKHLGAAEELCERGQYKEAVEECRQEIDTWQLRLEYNRHELSALRTMAQAYCRLEEYDKARDTYALIAKRYGGEDRRHAQKRVEEIRTGLEQVARYQDAASKEPDPGKKASILYSLGGNYRFRLENPQRALQVYEQILKLNVDESTKRAAREFVAILRGQMPTARG
jgi:tetratricopeptide (TPR) repeat protein